MKPSDRPINIPEKLWDAKMHIEGYWSASKYVDEVTIKFALELIIEYLIEERTKK